jgi:1-acyl-sn-glycerol-3-phosphate acyltransferase
MSGQPGTERGAAAVPPPRESIPFKFAQLICRVVTSVYFDLKVWGIEHVPRTGGVLLVANHQSFLDPILLGVRLPRSLSYMARSELFEVNPVFTWLIRSLGAFPVRQTGSAAGAIKEAVERLQEGRALNIYPEGSRTETGEIGPMEKGVALVIRKAKVPVVPVAIEGSFEAWRKGTTLFRPHPIRLLYGPPMDLNDKRPDEIVATIDRTVRGLFEELRARRASEPAG